MSNLRHKSELVMHALTNLTLLSQEIWFFIVNLMHSPLAYHFLRAASFFSIVRADVIVKAHEIQLRVVFFSTYCFTSSMYHRTVQKRHSDTKTIAFIRILVGVSQSYTSLSISV